MFPRGEPLRCRGGYESTGGTWNEKKGEARRSDELNRFERVFKDVLSIW